jgi:hypothetical protein
MVMVNPGHLYHSIEVRAPLPIPVWIEKESQSKLPLATHPTLSHLTATAVVNLSSSHDVGFLFGSIVESLEPFRLFSWSSSLTGKCLPYVRWYSNLP